MATTATIELRDMMLPTGIGTYGQPDETPPDYHLLDLTLDIDPGKALILEDGIEHVPTAPNSCSQIHSAHFSAPISRQVRLSASTAWAGLRT